MARLTRNSYKRKIILFAVFVFISIALISTGFAAWVMSSDAQRDSSGNVEVGLVTNGALSITIDNENQVDNFSFYFEPNTESGLIHLEKPDDPQAKLDLIIEGSITPVSSLNEANIEFILPNGFDKAIELNYVTAPTFYLVDTNGEKTELKTKSQLAGFEDAYVFTVNSDGSFKISVEFAWGTAFGGLNPCDYYNPQYAEAEKEYADALTNEARKLAAEKMNNIKTEAQTNLENLRACIYNYYTALTADGADRAAVIEANSTIAQPTYTISIFAKAN